jgi:hypothetical protein
MHSERSPHEMPAAVAGTPSSSSAQRKRPNRRQL